jgi:hypothetical protein
MPKDHFAFSVIFIASTVARGLVTLLLMRTHRSGLPVAKKN